MRKVYRVNSDGLLLEELLVEDNEVVEASQFVETPIPEGTYLPARFLNGRWQTVLTEEEIQAKNPDAEPSELEKLKKQQELMQEALDELLLGGGL